jgi:hypothetical protein
MTKHLTFGFLLLVNICGYSPSAVFFDQTGRYSIFATDTDSVDFPNYFEKQSKIDSISKNFDNWHLRALAIEKLIINDCSCRITIDRTSRIVKLQNGSEIILIPNDTVDEAGYTYEKEFKDLSLLLFRVQLFEGNNYFLLNTRTGKKTYTIGQVYVNPDKTFLMSINDDIVTGFSDNGFQLFEIRTNGEIKEIWKFSPFWAPDRIKWIDNSTLIVHGYYFSGEEWKYKSIYKKIKINEL